MTRAESRASRIPAQGVPTGILRTSRRDTARYRWANWRKRRSGHASQPIVRPVLAGNPHCVVRRAHEDLDIRRTRARRRGPGEAERRRSRREFLGDVVRVAASGALATVAGPLDPALAKPRDGSRSIAIVGAGMAGLACADRLREAGILGTVYEAAADVLGFNGG